MSTKKTKSKKDSKKKSGVKRSTAKVAPVKTDPSTALVAQKKLQSMKKRSQAQANRQALLSKSTLADLSDMLVSSPEDFYHVLHEIIKRSDLPFKIKLGNRYYPMKLDMYNVRTTFFGKLVDLEFNINVYDINWHRYCSVYDSDFLDSLGKKTVKKFSEVLASAKLSVATPEDIAEYKEAMGKCSTYRNSVGACLESVSSVLIHNRHFFGPRLIDVPLGSVKNPRLVIVEPELELADHVQDIDPSFPLLRVFSLDMKEYVYVDVRDVQAHEYQKNAIEKLVLPQDLKEIVTSVFEAKDVFGDLFTGRHGGMVVLANGSPGIGKTLTAEVFAEKTSRPLYVLEMGELGVQLDQVERALQLIFTRAARWNTVLLFDEADIFLSKRTEVDLERNAIVGVFLRLLDQYRGMLFLTTNRAESIDPAFSSRITLRLDYPELSTESRLKVWTHMLQSAEFVVSGNLEEVAEHPLNGRQIRNTVRLLKAISHGNFITTDEIKKYIKYAPIVKH